MTAFHVLAKIETQQSPNNITLTQQKHFIVKTSTESRAIELIEIATRFDAKEGRVQFTIKKATQLNMPESTSPDEEVFSL